ncbi:hypothetical protein IFO70_10440 [Phormidium tenue FACHB-886]|nr:hypothetical protein [Phormidium tenue FACHB-886]
MPTYNSKTILTAGTKLFVAKLAENQRKPVEYTVTNTAAATIGADELTLDVTGGDLAAGKSLFLAAGLELTYGTTLVEVALDTIVPFGTATAVPVEPVKAAVPASTASQTYAMLPLLGVTEANPGNESQTEDITNFLSGFGQEMNVTGINRNFQVGGFKIKGDRAMDNIVIPLSANDERAGEEIYALLQLESGDKFRGAAKVSSLNFANGVRASVKYSFQLMIQGTSYKYENGVAYAETVNA